MAKLVEYWKRQKLPTSTFLPLGGWYIEDVEFTLGTIIYNEHKDAAEISTTIIWREAHTSMFGPTGNKLTRAESLAFRVAREEGGWRLVFPDDLVAKIRSTP